MSNTLKDEEIRVKLFRTLKSELILEQWGMALTGASGKAHKSETRKVRNLNHYPYEVIKYLVRAIN